MELAEGVQRAGEMARVVAKTTRFWFTNVTSSPLLGLVREARALDGVVTVEDREDVSHALGNPLADSIFVTYMK